MKKSKPVSASAHKPAQDRQKRLAEALRRNLTKRKGKESEAAGKNGAPAAGD